MSEFSLQFRAESDNVSNTPHFLAPSCKRFFGKFPQHHERQHGSASIPVRAEAIVLKTYENRNDQT